MFRFCTLLLLAFSLVGCASTGAVPTPFPSPAAPPAGAPPPDTGSSPINLSNLVTTALGLRGAPYRPGGADPAGFDCSGFIQYVFARHGVRVPRTVEEQFRISVRVSRNDVRVGDLVFFRTDGRRISHVGLLVGGDEFVHAPNSRGEVRVERVGDAYWLSRLAGVRRVRE